MKHRASTYWLVAILGIIMWIIGGWNTDNGDFSNYEAMYEYDFLAMTLSNTADYGFFLILELFKIIGLDFIQTRIVLYFVFISLLSYITLKYCKRPLLALFLYFLVFYFRDVITLRNTVAMIFLFIGILCLISENCKFKKIKYSICILLASSIHISFLFYFVLLLKDVKFNVKIFALLVMMSSMLGKSILEMFSSFLFSEENGQIQAKIDGFGNSYISLIICSITILFSVYICKKNSDYLCERRLSLDVYKLNVAMMCLIILTSVSMTFIRLFYNILLFDIILMVNASSYKKKLYATSLFWFMWIYIWAFWMSNVSGNFIRIISNNVLL